MTPEEAIAYIHRVGFSPWKLGLSRTREVLHALGDPQDRLRFVHIAGTNGKGSVSAMLERILREAGLRTGLFTSPYIEDFRERIQCCGKSISEEALARHTERVAQIADAMSDHPTQFELITAIGMSFFAEEACDLVVLEVGLGGEFDATNVISAPEVAVITGIGFDHTNYLGNSLSEIAAAKAGIIKENGTVVSYTGPVDVMTVIRDVCAKKHANLQIVDATRVEAQEHSLQRQRFLWRHGKEEESKFLLPDGISLELSLLGTFQLQNAATVLTTVEVLRNKGYVVSDTAVQNGMRQVRWPARFEVLSFDPLCILDGGHNPPCAQALTESLSLYLPQTEVAFLFGVLEDKDYPEMIRLLQPFAKSFYCVPIDNPRALDPERLAQAVRSQGGKAIACSSVDEAMELAFSSGRAVVACGSLYFAGEMRSAFRQRQKNQYRQTAKTAVAVLSAEEKEAANQQIEEHVLRAFVGSDCKTILAYRPMDAEPDLQRLLAQWQEEGKRIAFPHCLDNQTMEALVPGPDTGFLRNGMGIEEPDPTTSQVLDPAEIDLVLAPCVAFDRNGTRLGHGAGYYDRYLENLSPSCQTVLVAFAAQEVPSILAAETDLPFSFVVTEEELIGNSPAE